MSRHVKHMGMMKTSIRTYLGLMAVFIASFACAYLLPINQVFKSIATTLAIAALVAVIYQILKDQAAFERQEYLQRQEQIFNLGATSHMANRAFDKHVEFCEKYMSEVHLTVTELVVHGPKSPKVNEHFFNLISIKKEYAAWVPKDVALQLEPFEHKISEMSAQAGVVEDYRGVGGKEYIGAVRDMHTIYRSLLRIGERDITKDGEEVSAEDIKEKLRSILGINELTKMRQLLVSGAIKFLEDG